MGPPGGRSQVETPTHTRCIRLLEAAKCGHRKHVLSGGWGKGCADPEGTPGDSGGCGNRPHLGRGGLHDRMHVAKPLQLAPEEGKPHGGNYASEKHVRGTVEKWACVVVSSDLRASDYGPHIKNK